MEAWNLYLFSLLNAGPHLAGWQLQLAVFAANGLIFLVPLVLVARWLWGPPEQRATLLMVFAAIALALAANLLISLAWYHPRPFMVPVGHTYLAHVPDSSFPSDHGTVMFTTALVFLVRRGTRALGAMFLPLAAIVAWARIYLGVHFPLDMLGALFIAIWMTAVIVSQEERLVRHIQPVAELIYRKTFAPLIRQRWVKD